MFCFEEPVAGFVAVLSVGDKSFRADTVNDMQPLFPSIDAEACSYAPQQ